MTTRIPCLSCGGSGTREEAHDFGAIELLGCEDCEATGWRPIAGGLVAEDAERAAALREALRPDEVYVVHVDGRPVPVYVFGHREDAEAFEAAVWGERSDISRIQDATVCDHAAARRLIEWVGSALAEEVIHGTIEVAFPVHCQCDGDGLEAHVAGPAVACASGDQ